MTVMLTDILRKVLADRWLSEIAAATGIDAGNLSRFRSGERSLSAAAAESLCRHLGIVIVRDLTTMKHSKSVLVDLRRAVAESDQSLRGISYRVQTSVANLSRFVRGTRTGLRLQTLDRLCQVLKLTVGRYGTLTVLAVERRGSARTFTIEPMINTTVKCVIKASSPQMKDRELGTKRTNSSGKAVFKNVPLGATFQVQVGDVNGGSDQMISDEQEFAVQF